MAQVPIADGSIEQGLYLTAAEAAELLGIAVPSLYAYVARKGIRSMPVEGTRKRLYWREDVESISKKGPKRAVNIDSVLVRETKITLLTEQGPFYRGRSAIELAEFATIEDVAAILWQQPRSHIFPDVAPAVPPGFDAARKALSSLAAREQAGSLFPFLEHSNPGNYDLSAGGFARAGGELCRWFVALAIGARAPSAEPIHLQLARGLKAPPGYDDIIRRLMVFLADHELSPDTYAVRAVANTGCTPHQAALAGMIAVNGRRIRQGRANIIRTMLEEILNDDDPGRPLINRFRDGVAIPGFEEGVYSGLDMRVKSLLDTLKERLGDDRDVTRLLKAVATARKSIGMQPQMAIVSLFIEYKLKIPPSGGTLLVASRMVGWLAHAFEQMESGPLVRPRTAYTGPLPEAMSAKVE